MLGSFTVSDGKVTDAQGLSQDEMAGLHTTIAVLAEMDDEEKEETP